jgi:hypothetical protein
MVPGPGRLAQTIVYEPSHQAGLCVRRFVEHLEQEHVRHRVAVGDRAVQREPCSAQNRYASRGFSRGVSLAVSSSGTRGPNDWVDVLVGDGYTEFTRSREETYEGYLTPQQTVARVRGWMLEAEAAARSRRRRLSQRTTTGSVDGLSLEAERRVDRDHRRAAGVDGVDDFGAVDPPGDRSR